MAGERGAGARGRTFVEVALVLALTGLAAATTAAGWRHWRGRAPLQRATAVARGELGRARAVAVARRAVVRLSVSGDGELVLSDADGRRLRSTPFRGAPFRLDSLRLRPATLRMNARGQGSPGSLYLYRGDRGVRIVSNFIGRLRVERFGL